MKFRRTAINIGMVLCCLSVCGANLVAPTAVYAQQVTNPNRVPRMITTSLQGDGETQMAFHWNTVEYTGSDVEVVRADDGKGFSSASVISASGSVYKSETADRDGWVHSCVAEGLEPNTKYIYRVGDEEFDVWSETGSFTTAKKGGKAFTFVHISDLKLGKKDEGYARALKSAMGEEPAFLALTGGIVSEDGGTASWETALGTTFSITNGLPVAAVAGEEESGKNEFAEKYTLPAQEGAKTETGVYYSFNYENAHFICLNTNDAREGEGISSAQYDWLKGDLADNQTAEWLIVLTHQAIYDGSNENVEKLQTQLAPLFTEYGVDLVLQGHNALYSQSYPLVVDESGKAEAQAETVLRVVKDDEWCDVYKEATGTVYLSSGSASGEAYTAEGVYDETLLRSVGDPAVPMYSAISVEGNEMYISTYTVNDEGETVAYQRFGIMHAEEARSVSLWAVAFCCIGIVVLIGGVIVADILTDKEIKKNNLQQGDEITR